MYVYTSVCSSRSCSGLMARKLTPNRVSGFVVNTLRLGRPPGEGEGEGEGEGGEEGEGEEGW